jgi:hypothetical protein
VLQLSTLYGRVILSLVAKVTRVRTVSPIKKPARIDGSFSVDVSYHETVSHQFWTLLDPARISVPRYQNLFRITVWLIFLFVYSQAGKLTAF